MIFLSGQTSRVAAHSYPFDECNDYYGYYNSTYYWYYGYYGNPYYYNYPYYCSPYYYSPSYGYNYGYNYGYQYSPPAAQYALTVTTDPSSLGTTSGGGTFTAGSSATFTVTQSIIQASPNTRYVFSHWSGDYSGVGTSGSITMNGASNVIAVYQLQNLLSVSAQPGSIAVPQGAGWYNAGDTVTLSVDGQILGGQDGSRLVFQEWSVDGQTNQGGTSLSIKMDSPHSVAAQYKQQYYLKVVTDQGDAYGEGWYDAGSTANVYVSTPVSTSYGVNIVFNGWQGDIQTNSQMTTVPMDRSKTVIATWRTDPTVLNLTIAFGIIAALLIAGGFLAYVLLGRRTPQSSTAPVVPEHAASTKTDESQPRKRTTPPRKKTPENSNASE
jgi:hypothetical protein